MDLELLNQAVKQDKLNRTITFNGEYIQIINEIYGIDAFKAAATVKLEGVFTDFDKLFEKFRNTDDVEITVKYVTHLDIPSLVRGRIE